MTRFSRISGAVDFLGCIVFSTAVIFLCSFGIIGVFKTLSKQDVTDLSNMANMDSSAVVSTITGISIDENSIGGKLSDGIQDIVYGFENKEDYSFSEAASDAKNLIGNTFGDFDFTTAMGDVMDSATDLIGSIGDIIT